MHRSTIRPFCFRALFCGLFALALLLAAGCEGPDENLSIQSGPGGFSDDRNSSGSGLPDSYSLAEPDEPWTADLGDGILLCFPAGWSELSSSGGLTDWANREQTVFLSFEKIPMDSVKGMTGQTVADGIRLALEQSYPPSSGYTVQARTLSLPSGDTAAIDVTKTGEPFREQIYLIRGSSVYTLTVAAPDLAKAEAVWSFLTYAD